MRRARFALAAALVLAACQYSPQGRCSTNDDCLADEQCRSGVCVYLPADRCLATADCGAWQECSPFGRCVAVQGRCDGAVDCLATEDCGAEHVCVLAPAACSSALPCEAWQECNLVSRCEAAPGRCTSDGQCLGLDTCVDHSCKSSLTTGEVLLRGTLTEGNGCVDALARLAEPTRIAVGFGCSADWGGVVRPDGRLVYRDGTNRLRLFTPDPFSRVSGRWTYPSSPEANDPVLPTPGCTGVLDWRLVGGTGEPWYTCDTKSWYDTSGALRLVLSTSQSLVAANAAGVVLFTDFYALHLRTAGGTDTLIVGPPSYADTVTARSDGDGFLVVPLARPEDERLWRVDAAGIATDLGAYPPVPATYGYYASFSKLDSAGVLYTEGYSSFDVVFSRVAGAASATVVYTEASADHAANDFSALTPSWFVKIHASRLVTGP